MGDDFSGQAEDLPRALGDFVDEVGGRQEALGAVHGCVGVDDAGAVEGKGLLNLLTLKWDSRQGYCFQKKSLWFGNLQSSRRTSGVVFIETDGPCGQIAQIFNKI